MDPIEEVHKPARERQTRGIRASPHRSGGFTQHPEAAPLPAGGVEPHLQAEEAQGGPREAHIHLRPA